MGRIAGEVAMLAPTLAIPGAATARGAAAIGGVTGGVLTPGDLKERAIAAGLGAAGGAAGSYLSRGAAARGSFEPSDAVKAMEREGISLTPGENIGGIFRRFEDRLTSTPFVGDIIEKSRIRGIEVGAVVAETPFPGGAETLRPDVVLPGLDHDAALGNAPAVIDGF